VAITGFATVAILALMAMALKNSFVFPSLGPTAFLFFSKPNSVAASPRNAILGHAIGIVCGYVALLLTGLEHAPPETVAGVNNARIIAAAFSLAATGAVMVLCNVVHAPAAATTLIISLGFITAPAHLLIIEAAVVVLAVQAIIVNRLAGIDFPLWAHRATEEPESPPHR
jgi:CBS-domain-containing membrane protein